MANFLLAISLATYLKLQKGESSTNPNITGYSLSYLLTIAEFFNDCFALK